MPLNQTATAATGNVAPNASPELQDGPEPTSWSQGKRGSNTATFQYVYAGGQQGTSFEQLIVSN